MKTWVKAERTAGTQPRAAFTGEGAYHGSTKPRPRPPGSNGAQPVVSEADPTTLRRYLAEGRTEIARFEARFPNLYRPVAQLVAPTQEEIQQDGVTFCWSPLDEALAEAGPLTRSVLEVMQRHVSGTKRFVYIDSKIQYFETGDLPVDSRLWHVDGSIAVRDERVRLLGASILHDLRARFDDPTPPLYLAYQSSDHCATRFVAQPLTLQLPELIPSFDALDAAVQSAAPRDCAQPAASIVAFDGLSLHRAVQASASGWRLWIRCTETDREIRIDHSVLGCYGTVFRGAPAAR
jgi:hypothetical protein